MGLFGKTDPCAICGGKLPVIGQTKILDGKICPACRSQCTQYISMPQRFTREDIVENIREAEENKGLYSMFSPQKFPFNLYVDFRNSLFAVAPEKSIKQHNAYIFRFDELRDYSITEDGNTIHKSGAGSAVVGGLLFGGIGLVAGGLAGRKTKETITKLSITIKTTNRWAPSIEIPIISAEIKKNSFTFKTLKNEAEKFVSTIDTMMQQ